MTTELVGTPFHTGLGDGPAVWHFGALLTFKATGEATAGRLWVKELQAARGMAVPMHVHAHEDEAFYVLDGEVGMHIGDDVIGASTGSFLGGPRTVPHAGSAVAKLAARLHSDQERGAHHALEL
jgi:quercetin dioxygenase-like cupin family protein